MCMNCLSRAELALMQGTAAVAFARAGVTRLRERWIGRDPTERRLAAHRANAEFLAGMGLDADAVLGPPPAVAAACRTAPAASRRTAPVVRGVVVPGSVRSRSSLAGASGSVRSRSSLAGASGSVRSRSSLAGAGG